MAPNFSKSLIESLVKEPIVDFTIKVGSNAGDNMAGDIHALKIQAVSGKTYDVVMKTLLEKDSQLKEMMRANRTFALEIGVYTKIRQELEKLIKSRGVENFPVPIPPFFGGVCDGENDFLCLEDMRLSGYKMPDKFIGLTLAEAKLILEELARFHGLTYTLIKNEGEKFFEGDGDMSMLKKNVYEDPALSAFIETMFYDSLQVAFDVIKIRDEKLAQQIQSSDFDKSRVYQTYIQVSRMTDKRVFPVIIHGDFWVNNILVKYNENDEPIAASFIDFQQTRRGNIFEDLLYFIFTSTTPELRASHLPQLLRTYFDTFNSTLVQLKSPMPANFTFGTFLDIFNEGYLFAYIYMSFAIPLQLGNLGEIEETPEEANELMSAERLRKLMDLSSRAVDRLEAITREFVQLKIFS